MFLYVLYHLNTFKCKVFLKIKRKDGSTLKIKGITSGTYLLKRTKDKNLKLSSKEICNRCKFKNTCKYRSISKFENGKVFNNNVECEYFYFIISPKAILTIGRDITTGRVMTKTFVGKNETEAFQKALNEKLKLDQNGGIKIITKSNKTIADLVGNVLKEDFKLGKIKQATFKRKTDTLKKLQKEKFTNIPITKVKRDDVIKYLESLKSYSKSTIKQNYELICMAFGQASYENIITDNFMTGWKRVEKPKSEYKSHHRKSLTIDEQRKLVDYLNSVSYEQCPNKYLFLLLLTTGMRVGEALVLDYEKDIDLINGKIYIRKTQTKNISGKAIIGETAKTENGERTLTMTNISKQIIESAIKHKIENKNHLLFCKKDKTMHIENSINSNLKRIAIKLGIGIYEEENKKGQLIQKTDVHTHCLRGTFATRCAEAKIAPAVLKKILGHSDIKVTMQYYIDVDSEFESSENENVEKYLIGKEIFGVNFSSESKTA